MAERPKRRFVQEQEEKKAAQRQNPQMQRDMQTYGLMEPQASVLDSLVDIVSIPYDAARSVLGVISSFVNTRDIVDIQPGDVFSFKMKRYYRYGKQYEPGDEPAKTTVWVARGGRFTHRYFRGNSHVVISIPYTPNWFNPDVYMDGAYLTIGDGGAIGYSKVSDTRVDEVYFKSESDMETNTDFADYRVVTLNPNRKFFLISDVRHEKTLSASDVAFSDNRPHEDYIQDVMYATLAEVAKRDGVPLPTGNPNPEEFKARKQERNKKKPVVLPLSFPRKVRIV
jgi:hypothetical protein